MLLRQIQSLHSRVENRLARGTELLGDSPQDDGAVESGIGIETGADVIERRRPRLLNRCPHVPAPEASHVLKSPDDVIAAHGAEQKHIQGQGGGTDVAVPENEPAEQAGVAAVRGVVEIAVAVHEEQKHISVSQVGAGRNPFSTKRAVLIAERQVPGRVLDHQVEHAGGQLVVVNACIPR